MLGLVLTSVSSVPEVCRDLWNLDVSAADIVESDSSTASKWSRHLLIRIAGHALPSNVHVGYLVKSIILKHPLASQLEVTRMHDGRQVATSFIDDSVYTRHVPHHILNSSVSFPSDLQPAHNSSSHRCLGTLVLQAMVLVVCP
jgi:hypothetical protein